MYQRRRGSRLTGQTEGLLFRIQLDLPLQPVQKAFQSALSQKTKKNLLQDIKSLEAIQSARNALPHASFSKYALMPKRLLN